MRVLRVMPYSFFLGVALTFGLTQMGVASPIDEARPETIVKIISQPCRGYPVYNGTGVLFNFRNQVYVLTSDHVFLHGDQGICHTVSNSSIGEVKASYFASDWATGLGVLSVPGLKASVKQRSFETLTRGLISSPGSTVMPHTVLTMGYPAESDTLLSSYRGEFIQGPPSDKIFFSVFSLLETKNAHGEFGMSGGPVFSGPQAHFVGILSHQVLRTTQDNEREAAPWDAAHDVVNNLLVIPQSVVGPWLEKLFSQNFIGFTFFEYPFQQINEARRAVTVEDVAFDLTCSIQTRDYKTLCSTYAGISNRTHFERFSDPLGSLSTIKNAVQARQSSVRIASFYSSSDLSQPRRVLRFNTLLEFLRLLQDPQWLPAIDISGTLRTDYVDEKLVGFYRQLYQWEKYYVRLPSWQETNKVKLAVRQILAALEPVGPDRKPENYHMISRRDLEDLLSNPKWNSEWATLSGSMSLRTILKELSDYYKLLTY